SDDKKMLYYPHGATATSYLEINPEDGSCTREVIFEFPDDDITLLLTKYGHNRCLNGARAVEDISVDPDAER
ncbi:MAG: hypothetical protein IJC43_00200, partial [Clostridia bacterium]|nr:hypothetical protein [Clostridia bacterium]